MKSKIRPLPPGLPIDTDLGVENEQSGALAIHAVPDAPPPLNPTLGNPTTTNAVIVLTGTEGNDTIIGLAVDEQIEGLGGDDVLVAGAGNDTVRGGAGNDILFAGSMFRFGDVPPPNGPTDSNILFGGAGDDYLYGDEGIDVLSGDDGNDIIQDDNGDDSLHGGAGNDLLNGGSGADILDGDDGYDTVSYSYSDSITIDLTKPSSTWTGDAQGDVFISIEEFQLPGSGPGDVFIGAGGNEVVFARRGNDTVNGGGGDDTIDGGAGDDTLQGGDGNDVLRGGVGEGRHGPHAPPPFGGNDSLSGGNGNDALDAGDGDDLLDGGAGADTMSGGVGFDTASYADAMAGVTINLSESSSTWTGDAQGDVFVDIERISLSNFADLFIGDANANQDIFGGAGDDRLIGLGGDDGLTGGNGNDLLEGGDGNDVLRGDGFATNPGNDLLFGNAGDDVLRGDGGDDALWGGSGADVLDGGTGYDTAEYGDGTSAVSIDLTADSSTWTGDAQGDTLTSIEAFDLTVFNDIFRGADGNDTVISRAGDDQLFGRGGNDTLVAGEGNDILSGGLGADVLIGEQGADVFKYTSAEESSGAVVNGVQQIDDIADFTQGQDNIDLSAIDANGTLAGNQAFTFLDNPASHTGDWTGFVWSVTDGNGHTMIFASTDADGDPEMQIYLPQVVQLHASDFVL